MAAPLVVSEPVTEMFPLLEVERFADADCSVPETDRSEADDAVRLPVVRAPPSAIVVPEVKLAALVTVTLPLVVTDPVAFASRLPADRVPPRVKAPPVDSSAVAALTEPLVVSAPVTLTFRSPLTVLADSATEEALSVRVAELPVFTVRANALVLLAEMVPEVD